MARIITVRLRSSLRKLNPAKSPALKCCGCLEQAKLHAALAKVPATASHSDDREWVEVAGPHVQRLSIAFRAQGQDLLARALDNRDQLSKNAHQLPKTR